MPLPLFLVLTAVSLVLAPPAGMATRPLSEGNGTHRGLLIPTLLALWVYLSFALLYMRYGIGYALLMLAIMNIPLVTSLAVYLTVRLRRHNALAAKYREQQKAKKPTVAASAHFHALLKGFSCRTVLSPESLHEVVILIKSGTSHEKIAATYDCTVSEVQKIEKAFDRYRAEQESDKAGVDYTLSPEQGELFLQLMTNATPKSLACGDRLLWNPSGVARLIQKATGICPSRKSVAAFLSDFGLFPNESDLARTKTPEALAWIEEEYRKIRMSALERGSVIYWVYSPTPSKNHFPRKTLLLTAVTSDRTTVFGIYKGSGGFADFLNKLAQEAPAPVYAVICTDYKDYKNLDAISPEITLFPLGETAKIPETV